MEIRTNRENSLREQAAKKIGHFGGYRTVSFFGFNPPDRIPQIKHFHIVEKGSTPTKYKPLRRSKSLDELFSTERALNDEKAFARAVNGRIASSGSAA